MDTNEIMDIIFESSSSSSSSSSDGKDEVVDYLRKKRTDLRSIPRIKLYVENIISQYSSTEFKSHFRMLPSTFDEVLRLIGPVISKTTVAFGSKPIDPKKQLLITLWVFATPDSYRSVCEKFDVGQATALRSVRRVTAALYDLAKNIIKWPTEEQAEATSTYFRRKNGFPKIIRAVDGTHIRIDAPTVDAISYVNRKGFHSIQLQAVCDEKLKFISTYAGSVGSVHDARVFRVSPLVQNFANPDIFFPNDSNIIGDSAYPLSRYLLTPFRNNGNLTRRQRNFNFCLSSCRMVIEKAFGLLKCRFRRLLHCLPMTDVSKIPEYIISCCVLYNICIDMNDIIEIDDDYNNEHMEGEEMNINIANAHLHREGDLKRYNITETLPLVVNYNV